MKSHKVHRLIFSYGVLTITVLSVVFSTSQFFLATADELEGIHFIKSRNILSVTTESLLGLSSDVSVKNENCTPAAIEQFPRPLIPNSIRKQGAIAIHIIITLYAFLALAVVCDEYFVPALECLCEALNVQSDVAGATFMAAGSSAPELATSVIAVFITKDDIGVGTVVGSAVYNIAFVIAICGLFAGKVVYLNWWPLCRDCLFYTISIIALIIAIGNEAVTWLESVMFLLLYILYIAFMFVNNRVERYLTSLPWLQWLGPHVDSEQTHLIMYKGALGGGTHLPETHLDTGSSYPQEEGNKYVALSSNLEKKQELESAESAAEDSLFSCPKNSICKLLLWVISFPLLLACYFTIPDCRKPRWQKWYFLTFLNSCIWIGFLSYILVWMITIIGFTFQIPDTVMGLTLLAAGVSVPDAISSLLVVRNGFGDMAISNAIGSNVFDILLCLGLPWFLQTVVIRPGSVVRVYSKGLIYSTICLLSTVLFLLVVTHLNGWKLNRKYGAIMMVWYIFFMLFSGLYEGNVFSLVNLPMCPSDY